MPCASNPPRGDRSAISGLRYYSPSLGRFINKDPIEEKGGLNLYAFCRNNGVNGWDVLGNDFEDGMVTGSDGSSYYDYGRVHNSYDGFGRSTYIAPGGMPQTSLGNSSNAALQGLADSMNLSSNMVTQAVGADQWTAEIAAASGGTNSPSGQTVDLVLTKLVVHGNIGDDLESLTQQAANAKYGHGAIIGGPTNTWALAYPATTTDKFMTGPGGAITGQLLQGTANFVQIPAGTLNQSMQTANRLTDAVLSPEQQQQLALLFPELSVMRIPTALEAATGVQQFVAPSNSSIRARFLLTRLLDASGDGTILGDLPNPREASAPIDDPAITQTVSPRPTAAAGPAAGGGGSRGNGQN